MMKQFTKRNKSEKNEIEVMDCKEKQKLRNSEQHASNLWGVKSETTSAYEEKEVTPVDIWSSQKQGGEKKMPRGGERYWGGF